MNKLLYFLLIIAFTSCEDAIEEVPQFDLVGGNAIVDQSSAEASLLGAYSNLTYDEGNGENWHPYFDFGYVSTVGHMTGLLGEDSPRYIDEDSYNFDYQTSYYRKTVFNDLDNAWKFTSAVINGANIVLEEVPEVVDDLFTANRKKEILGEAHFLRGFGFLYLLRYYGYHWDINSEFGGLCRTEPAFVGNIYWARDNVKDSYAYILADLDKTIEYEVPFTSVFHASALLAKMYKAEVLLMRGEEGDYQEALNLSEQIIASGERRTEDVYADIFKNQYDSPELLFTRANNKVYVANAMDEPTRHDNLFSAFGPKGRMDVGQLYLDICADDARKDSLIKEVTYQNQTRDVFTNFVDLDDGDSPMYMARMAQAYLMKAEALFRMNGIGSLNQIVESLNVLRLRSGNEALNVQDIDNEILLNDILFKEVIKELNVETDYVWSCFTRFKYSGKPAVYEWRNEQLEDRPMDFVVWPIPFSEMSENRKMVQNPAYKHLK